MYLCLDGRRHDIPLVHVGTGHGPLIIGDDTSSFSSASHDGGSAASGTGNAQIFNFICEIPKVGSHY
jgi:hypothetical protein